jgi:hypothetical protein
MRAYPSLGGPPTCQVIMKGHFCLDRKAALLAACLPLAQARSAHVSTSRRLGSGYASEGGIAEPLKRRHPRPKLAP